MTKLRNSYFFLILIFLQLASCQSIPRYSLVTHPGSELHTIEVDSNRVTQECNFLNAEKENNWRHLYVMSFLNEKNEVIPIAYPVTQDIDDCMKHLKKVAVILKKEPRVRICARDKLEKITDPEVILTPHDFGKFGKHKSDYDALTFDSICNAKDCVSINHLWYDTCPGFQKQPTR